MGLKFLTKRDSHFFVIFLLILSQFFPIVFVSSTNAPFDPENPTLAGVVIYRNFDLAANEDHALALLGRSGFVSLDLTNPKKPVETQVNISDPYFDNKFLLYENTVLKGRNNYGWNYSIISFDLENLDSNGKEIAWFYGVTYKMKLTNDSLYCLNYHDSDNFDFLIYNATNLDTLSLLGNSTIPRFYRDNYHYETFDLAVQDDFVYLINDEDDLLIYHINSTYQLEFVKEYVFPELEEIRFYRNYMFTCDNQSLQVFDHSDPSNLLYKSHYNLTNTNAVRFSADIACIISDKAFTTIDISNINSLSLLDQYSLAIREIGKLNLLELQGNLAIVLTKETESNSITNDFSGPMYIFDISNPSKLDRVYPIRIPFIGDFGWGIFGAVMVLGVIPLSIGVGLIILRKRRIKEGKMHYEDIDKIPYSKKERLHSSEIQNDNNENKSRDD